jgi:hypothetical protein
LGRGRGRRSAAASAPVLLCLGDEATNPFQLSSCWPPSHHVPVPPCPYSVNLNILLQDLAALYELHLGMWNAGWRERAWPRGPAMSRGMKHASSPTQSLTCSCRRCACCCCCCCRPCGTTSLPTAARHRGTHPAPFGLTLPLPPPPPPPPPPPLPLSPLHPSSSRKTSTPLPGTPMLCCCCCCCEGFRCLGAGCRARASCVGRGSTKPRGKGRPSGGVATDKREASAASRSALRAAQPTPQRKPAALAPSLRPPAALRLPLPSMGALLTSQRAALG